MRCSQSSGPALRELELSPAFLPGRARRTYSKQRGSAVQPLVDLSLERDRDMAQRRSLYLTGVLQSMAQSRTGTIVTYASLAEERVEGARLLRLQSTRAGFSKA